MDIFGLKHGVNTVMLSQVRFVPSGHLDDAVRAVWRYAAFLLLFLLCWSSWLPRASVLSAQGGILSLHDTPEQLCGLGNVTGAYVNKVVNRKWVNFQFSISP